ncbi:MAG: IS630 family transposase [Deltaproteobacteria bacterium]|nr:MAG: IS630 family transposase [Deltaproteobacteria bacterium]
MSARLGRTASRNTLRQILKQAGLSWKRAKKLLAKADPVARAEFVQQLQALFDRLIRNEVRLVFVDEAHIHQDLDVGFTWAPKGQPAWRASSSPGLDKRLDWYGAYDFTQGRTFLWHGGKCNSEHTVRFLEHLAEWLGETRRQVVLIWDGASYHRSKQVRAAAQGLDVHILSLPAYSPDLNPVERLWQWMREEVTRLHCHQSLYELFQACMRFIETINQDPDTVLRRLWPKFDLDPEFEKLLFSN